MKIKITQQAKQLGGLLSRRYRGFPVGILVGIALVAGTSVYAAPMLFSSSTKPKSSSNQLDKVQQPTGTSIKDSGQSNAVSSQVSVNSNTPSNSQKQQDNNTTSSDNTSSSNNSSPQQQQPNQSSKPAPTMTGISVSVPGYGQTVTMNIPECDYESINSGTPETCHHYQPISFTLVATYSDGSTSSLSWSNASISSLSYDIPRLFNVDSTNNTLIEGNGLQYYNTPMNATVPMNITYQNWSYTEYINVIINSMWGN